MNSQNAPFRRSRHLAFVIIVSDWRRAGCNEFNSIALERLQIVMKNMLPEDGVVTLNPQGNMVWQLDWSIRHHELMLPRWCNFARASEQQEGEETAFTIQFGRFQLPDPVLEIL